ncbi:MAG TPA: bifunctional DNA-formamidopyrimidine glycosylase/DNA-(apurinic or apyrimidinic site) lyase [Candidatus Paceibacterota bacterium]|jgi:formamidopyrimidine-DNA glycosylase|nr:bifunctional DNA-formamidopyrimidine glycosylase/DNA-(apurinic or apyrimidinic site) lyase [Candidatus Paceibacterota bacterium]HQQ22192.1 bifunctional DNA-formamidopyrimidine glycosylase/DNA-(apurinic or apyrimidinic site) lyase [Candidatus Paceibacterota bacterium]
MPELPEVTTTVSGLQKVLPQMTISGLWTDLAKKDQTVKQFKRTIKDEKFFLDFKKKVIGQKIIKVTRRAKNILIDISGEHTILIHLKMTGHLLFGNYYQEKKTGKWLPRGSKALADPFNRFVHLVFTLEDKKKNKKFLVFSDARKFGKVTLFRSKEISLIKDLKDLGPEPLEESFTFKVFKDRLALKPRGKIKTVLMNQNIIAGIGNIYSDEMLWQSGINPNSICIKIPDRKLKLLWEAMRQILEKSIILGGDSTSDYRNIKGEKGNFQKHHKVYRQSGKRCPKPKCCGIIKREIIGGRSAHFCPKHQELFK